MRNRASRQSAIIQQRLIENQKRHPKLDLSFNSSLIYFTGFLDSVGFVQYIANIEQTYFYLFIIFLKFTILMTYRWNLQALFPATPLLGTILFGLLLSSGANSVYFIDVMRVIVAITSIAFTVLIIDGDFRKYAIGLAINGFLISFLYILQYRSGSIVVVYDRLYFFNGTHPNLGGEILSAIVIFSTFALRPMAFSALFLISSYCCWLMQSRTSILAMIICAILYGIFWVYQNMSKLNATLTIFIISFVGVIFLIIEANSGSETPARIADFLLERFSTVLNRKGFPRDGFSDSASVLVKEASMDGSAFIVGFACSASCGD